MRIVTWLAGGAFALAATTAAAAQPAPAPDPHAQHQASGQHQTPEKAEKCCCEEMIRKMMMEMMQKHQGKEMMAPKGAPQPGKGH